jgi:hypothetical protein
MVVIRGFDEKDRVISRFTFRDDETDVKFKLDVNATEWFLFDRPVGSVVRFTNATLLIAVVCWICYVLWYWPENRLRAVVLGCAVYVIFIVFTMRLAERRIVRLDGVQLLRSMRRLDLRKLSNLRNVSTWLVIDAPHLGELFTAPASLPEELAHFSQGASLAARAKILLHDRFKKIRQEVVANRAQGVGVEQRAVAATHRDEKERRLCVDIVMGDDWFTDEGVECANGHFISDETLANYVRALAKETAAKHRGTVKCPAASCDSQYEGRLLALHLPADLFDAWMKMMKSAIEMEMEREFDKRIDRAVAEATVTKSISTHRHHIVDKLLTLRCPRCNQAFVDFDACFALTCSRCRCGFCAWCLVDCGDSGAHRHVANCSLNQGEKCEWLLCLMDDNLNCQST